MAQSCYACCAQLQCLPPDRALVIAVWTALLKTPLLARCAARCAVYLWGKNPQFADRYMSATADACVVCDNMNRATSHSCMHHVLTRLLACRTGQAAHGCWFLRATAWHSGVSPVPRRISADAAAAACASGRRHDDSSRHTCRPCTCWRGPGRGGARAAG